MSVVHIMCPEFFFSLTSSMKSLYIRQRETIINKLVKTEHHIVMGKLSPPCYDQFEYCNNLTQIVCYPASDRHIATVH